MMDWSPAGGTTGPRNQLLSLVAYTGPVPKHAPKPASVTGRLMLVGQTTLFITETWFFIYTVVQRSPNCRLVHQPVLSTAYHTTAQGRCRPGYLLAGNTMDMNTDEQKPHLHLLSSDLYPHDSLLVPYLPV